MFLYNTLIFLMGKYLPLLFMKFLWAALLLPHHYESLASGSATRLRNLST